jgi:hypothetical protein
VGSSGSCTIKRAPLFEQHDILGREPAEVRQRVLVMPQT